MALSWDEIKTRGNAFSKEWQDAAKQSGQTLSCRLFEMFSITNKRVDTFESSVKKQAGNGRDGAEADVKNVYVDLFACLQSHYHLRSLI